MLALACGGVSFCDIIVDSNHAVEYLKYAATRRLFTKKGDKRLTDERLSAVSRKRVRWLLSSDALMQASLKKIFTMLG
jgi:hypothetical protein